MSMFYCVTMRKVPVAASWFPGQLQLVFLGYAWTGQSRSWHPAGKGRENNWFRLIRLHNEKKSGKSGRIQTKNVHITATAHFLELRSKAWLYFSFLSAQRGFIDKCGVQTCFAALACVLPGNFPCFPCVCSWAVHQTAFRWMLTAWREVYHVAHSNTVRRWCNLSLLNV